MQRGLTQLNTDTDDTTGIPILNYSSTQLLIYAPTTFNVEGQTSKVEYRFTSFKFQVSSFKPILVGSPPSGITNPASCILRSAFSSKEHDTASGLTYYGFRYYDPHSARWMIKEPSGADGPNQYWFVWNAPVQLLDYRGFEAIYPQRTSTKTSYEYLGIYHDVYFSDYENSLECCVKYWDSIETKLADGTALAGFGLTVASVVFTWGTTTVLVVGGSTVVVTLVANRAINEWDICTARVFKTIGSSHHGDDKNLSLNQPPTQVTVTPTPMVPVSPLFAPCASLPAYVPLPHGSTVGDKPRWSRP